MTISRDFLATVATPSLVIDLEIAQRNISRAADYFSHRKVRLRPHFKAHKISTLMRMQIDAGSCSGVTCATAYEAEILASAGFDDILVANQVVDPAGLAALARAASMKRVSVAVDCQEHVVLLQSTAELHAVQFGILIEIDIGMGRCGLNFNSDELIPLVSAIHVAPRLEFLGLQGYEGHVVTREDRGTRRTMVWQCQEALRYERERLQKHGYPCAIISGGGTGTFDLAAEEGVLTEVQAGSYVLMDKIYANIDTPFENALFCCATLISRRQINAGVLNVGLKSLTAEYGMPLAADGYFSVISLSDEHARITPKAGWSAEVGDNTLLIPTHVDPVMNLHDVVVVYGSHGLVDHWLVDGRQRPGSRVMARSL